MGSTSRAWIAATSIGAVEALKDQLGFCRWNFVMRSVHQHAKANLSSFSQAKKFSVPSSSLAVSKMRDDERVNQSEESLRKVMYLSCWGPN